jgi:hypothetical protein
MIPWTMFWSLNPSSYNSNNKVLGGEVCAWSEMNNEFDVMTKMFPRSAAMSFEFWNPSKPNLMGEKHETLMRLQYRLKSYGVATSKVSMRYCEEHTHHCFGL